MKQASISTILLTISVFLCHSMAAASFLEKRGIPSCYKTSSRFTQYWIPKEGDKDMTNNGKSVTLTGAKNKALKDRKGKTIAKVSKITYEKFQMEGTGLLESGVLVNLDHGKDMFMSLDRKKTPYGVGTKDGPLVPWVSVATNDIEKGTTLYVKKLDGLVLPNGKKHNGCVRVDDEGWSLGGCQLDFFVLQFTAYKQLTDKLPEKLSVVQKSCTIQNYITSAVQKWAVLPGNSSAPVKSKKPVEDCICHCKQAPFRIDN